MASAAIISRAKTHCRKCQSPRGAPTKPPNALPGPAFAGWFSQAMYDAVLHPSMVMELDSSTPEKWSRHVTMRLPGLAFAHNLHAGWHVGPWNLGIREL